MDKSTTNAYYEIAIDPETSLPVGIEIMLLAGQRGKTKVKRKGIVGGKHVVFNFHYKLSSFGQAEPLEIPPKARKLLAKR